MHCQRCLTFRLSNYIKHYSYSVVQTRLCSERRGSALYKVMKMHGDQINIPLCEARHLILEQFPQFNGMKVVELSPNAGTVNSIFRIGIKATARFPLQNQYEPEEFVHHLQTEAAAMTEFADNCCFLSPRPIGIGQPALTYPSPWSIQTWVEGDPNTPTGLAYSETFTHDLARLIKCLRSISVRGRAFDGQGRGGHIPDHAAWMEICFANSANLLDVPRLRSLWDFFRDLPPSEGPEVMSHRDLIPMNILVQGEHIAGVLDTGSFGPADRALDLVALWHMLEKGQRQVAREILGTEEVEWWRGAAWAFEQAMGLVWYYEQSNPVAAALGRHTLRRLLEDQELNSLLGAPCEQG